MFFLGLSLANAADVVVAPVSAVNIESIPFTLSVEDEVVSRLSHAKINFVEPLQVMRENSNLIDCYGKDCARELLYYPESVFTLQSLLNCQEDECFLELAVYNSKDEKPIYLSGYRGSYLGIKAQIQGAVAFLETELQKDNLEKMKEGVQQQEQDLQSIYGYIKAEESKAEDLTQTALKLPDALRSKFSSFKIQHDLKQKIKVQASELRDLETSSQSI